MWGNQILDKTLKIPKIRVGQLYSIVAEFDLFHKLEFDMFVFIT